MFDLSLMDAALLLIAWEVCSISRKLGRLENQCSILQKELNGFFQIVRRKDGAN
ncbi:hypothetical protein D3C78_607500 [compost metagenome]